MAAVVGLFFVAQWAASTWLTTGGLNNVEQMPADVAATDNLNDRVVMLTGVLVGDSLRPGAVLEGFPLTVTRIERAQAGQGEQPPF
jgi:hypothetical protein